MFVFQMLMKIILQGTKSVEKSVFGISSCKYWKIRWMASMLYKHFLSVSPTTQTKTNIGSWIVQ